MSPNPQRPSLLGILLVAGFVALVAWVPWYFLTLAEPVIPPPFTGKLVNLRDTVVVPTLDTPIPAGKSAIWCASFEMAWKRLQEDIVREPIRLQGAQGIADRLNRVTIAQADLPPGTYATAGYVNDGINATIRREMARRFPQAELPDLAAADNAILAFAYLQASTRFAIPFRESKPIPFRESGGRQVQVAGFGVTEEVGFGNPLLKQVEVLYQGQAGSAFIYRPDRFAIDLDQKSPVQVVIARLDRGSTLAEMLADLDSKVNTPFGRTFNRELGQYDLLFVPNMSWKVEHRYRELEGRDRRFLNAGFTDLYIDQAWQAIAFKLDRTGATLESFARVAVKGEEPARHFLVNGPYLLYLKRRDAQRPFFAMWVDNAELLEAVK